MEMLFEGMRMLPRLLALLSKRRHSKQCTICVPRRAVILSHFRKEDPLQATNLYTTEQLFALCQARTVGSEDYFSITKQALSGRFRMGISRKCAKPSWTIHAWAVAAEKPMVPNPASLSSSSSSSPVALFLFVLLSTPLPLVEDCKHKKHFHVVNKNLYQRLDY